MGILTSTLPAFMVFSTVSIVYASLYSGPSFILDFWRPYIMLSLLLFATYLLNKITDTQEDLINTPFSAQPSRLIRHKILLPITILLFIASFTFCILTCNGMSIKLWILSFLFSVFYSVPQKYRLKNILLVKNLTPSIVWILAFSILQLNIWPDSNLLDTLMASTQFGIFIFMYEVLWDIPDIKGDAGLGIRTLPNTFGVTGTIFFILVIDFLVLISYESIISKALATYTCLCLLLLRENWKKNTLHLITYGLLVVFLIFSFVHAY